MLLGTTQEVQFQSAEYERPNDRSVTKVYVSQSSVDEQLKKNNSLLSITSSNISHLTVNNNKTYDIMFDDEEHRSSCESGNYNEEFSSTRNLIKNSETAYLDADESDQQHEQFTRDQLDSFILNPNRQLNTSEPEYYRDSRVNYDNDIDEFRQNETSESSTSSSYDEPDEREDEFDEADSSENSEYYENSDSDDNRSTADSLTSSDDELNDENLQLASTMQLIRKKSSGHHSTTTNDSQFVGHFDGSKPLLMEDDDYDEEERTKEGKLIDIDDGEENLFEAVPGGAAVQNSITYMPAADQQEATGTVSQRAATDLLNQSNRSNLSNLSNLSQEDELDKEVASNLYRQVEQDKMRNKDLFGSKPFNQETREALKCKLNIETSSFNKEKSIVGQPAVEQPNIFTDNQFNKMNVDQIKSMQISSMSNNQPSLSVGQVGDRVDSSTLSAIATTLLENQGKSKKGDKLQSVKLPNVIKKQQQQQTSKPNEQQPSVQLAIETALNSSSSVNYESEMMASPSTLFDHESNLKVIKSTKSSKLPSSLRHKDEKHHSKTKVKLHKSKLNPSKLKGSQKNYKGIEEYDDDVDELLSADQDDLSQAVTLNNRPYGKDEKTAKKKSKESKLGLSISRSKDKEKSKDKEREKKDKKHKEKKEEKRLKKESKKSSKSSDKPRGFAFANMSFEDNIEDKFEELEETRC